MQAHTLAQVGDLPRALTLECKAQALFTLPADLGCAQLQAIESKAVVDAVEPLQATGFDLATDLDQHLVLHHSRVFRQLAGDAPVLAENHQTAGARRQRREQLLISKMFFEGAQAGNVFSPQALRL